MYDVQAFRGLYDDYRPASMPFLQLARRCAARTRPYQGLKILHNVPLTIETMFKIEALMLAGAELSVTCPSFAEPSPRALELLDNAGVDVQLELTAGMARDVDVMLDCGGELCGQVTPRIGASELTGTGTSRYRKADLDYPVIAVDECRLKDLETLLGTGESFVLAIQQLVATSITGQPFLVFCYGKVGRGVVRALRRHTAEIGVVDTDPAAVAAAGRAGCDAMHADEDDRVEAWARRAFLVVTATGAESVISSRYDAEAFRGSYLANLGGEDEFGDAFGDHQVLYGKRPVNFACSEPSLVRYLDPVFYAHNTGIDLLVFSPPAPGVHPFPSFLAEPMIELWQQSFAEALPDSLP